MCNVFPRFQCCNYDEIHSTHSFVLPMNGIDFVSKQIKINGERKVRENQFVLLPKSFNPDTKSIRVISIYL